jgi:plasmid stability protein
MRQIITRVDDELADALKRQARQTGESVNSYVNRLLRVAVVGPGSSRQMWKAAAVADGRLLPRPPRTGRRRRWTMDFTTPVTTSAGYAGDAVSAGREER